MTAIVKADKKVGIENSNLEAWALVDAVFRVLSFCDRAEVLFGDRIWDKPKNNHTLFLTRSYKLPTSLPCFKSSTVGKMLPVFTLIV